VGVGRVSADGSVIETISGGVNSATWHAFLPPFLDFLDFLKDLLDKLLCSDCNTGAGTARSGATARPPPSSSISRGRSAPSGPLSPLDR